MPKTRAQKEVQLKKLTEDLSAAKAVVFTDYKGMTMGQLSDLRNRLYDQKAQFSITKNTLLSIALKETGKPETSFKGPVGTLFAYDDEITPIKTLVKALKDFGIGKIKSGILGTESLDSSKVQQLSTLPSRDELRGKVVGVLAAPLQGIVGVLQGNLRNLVYALSEIQKQRGGAQ